VIVASATEHGLLAGLLAALDLHEVEHLGSDVAVARTGLRVRRHNYGAMKPVLLAEHFGLARWDLAYSDAWSDLPLLAGAEAAVVVNPSAALAERFDQALGARVRAVRWD
jgi:phosphatidylglycerophosphatase C